MDWQLWGGKTNAVHFWMTNKFPSATYWDVESLSNILTPTNKRWGPTFLLTSAKIKVQFFSSLSSRLLGRATLRPQISNPSGGAYAVPSQQKLFFSFIYIFSLFQRRSRFSPRARGDRFMAGALLRERALCELPHGYIRRAMRFNLDLSIKE